MVTPVRRHELNGHKSPPQREEAVCRVPESMGRQAALFSPEPANTNSVIKIIPVAGAEGNLNNVIKIITPVLGDAAYHGPIGEFIHGIGPYTEATDAGLLAHSLAAAGFLAGPGFYVHAGSKQPARVNFVVVGPTSTGRKGTAASVVDEVGQRVDPELWTRRRVSGLSSGEGLIEKLADYYEKKDDGTTKRIYVEKRLLVVEPEFSRLLANIRREGNIVSQVIREAYDTGFLSTLTVKPRIAAGAHVSIVAHITLEELAARFGHIEMANGFGNRFGWILSKSEKVLPHTEPFPEALFFEIEKRLRTLQTYGNEKQSRCVALTTNAQKLWVEWYPHLRADRPGMVGAMTARGSSMVLRLALVYALVDNAKGSIGPAHLKAAKAVWEFSCTCAAQLFGSAAVDSLSTKVLDLLLNGPMTRTKFNSHLSADQKEQIDGCLSQLESEGRITKSVKKAKGAGRPAVQYALVQPNGPT